MAVDLQRLNRNVDNVVQHILCDLEPDLREPIDILLGEMMAVIAVQQAEIRMRGDRLARGREELFGWIYNNRCLQ